MDNVRYYLAVKDMHYEAIAWVTMFGCYAIVNCVIMCSMICYWLDVSPWFFALCQLIAIDNVLCIRGYWDPPADISKYAMIDWFKSQMEQAGLDNLSSALYFPNFSGKCIVLSCLREHVSAKFVQRVVV